MSERSAHRLTDQSDAMFSRARLEVDVAVLTVRQGRLGVLAARTRTDDRGSWGLPLTPVAGEEDCDAAAERVLLLQAAAVSGRDTMFLEQLRTYSEAPSEPTERRVSVAYVALVANLSLSPSATGISRVFDVDDLANTGVLAADHEAMLFDAIERVRSKLEYTTVATSLVTEPFTIPELRRVYESVWGVTLHPANFRRKVLATPEFVRPEAADDIRRGPDLYRRGSATLLHPAMLRPQ